MSTQANYHQIYQMVLETLIARDIPAKKVLWVDEYAYIEAGQDYPVIETEIRWEDEKGKEHTFTTEDNLLGFLDG